MWREALPIVGGITAYSYASGNSLLSGHTLNEVRSLTVREYRLDDDSLLYVFEGDFDGIPLHDLDIAKLRKYGREVFKDENIP